jgi:DNA helicase IV
VLATLQPDQYEFVTASPERPLVIQGHPGTGKTVIAAHRAAFLVHGDNERRCRRVLVVGPTKHYVKHIRGVLDDLVEGPDKVDAMALDEALLDLRGLSVEVDDSQPAHFRDVDDELSQLAERAVHLLRDGGLIGHRKAHAACVEAAYEALRRNKVGTVRISTDRAWADYLRALPSIAVARTQRRYLPLLAACGAAALGTAPYFYDHVIVDEAQDVTALEWAVLKEINPRGSWTLLGDMNQRRSDLSCHSWSQVAAALGQPLSVETLQRGYRTTAAIMQFAGRLLPKAERTLDSLQTGGAPPRVEKVRPTHLYTRVTGEILGLLTAHPDGTVAVIGMVPRETMRALRRAGYTVDSDDRHTMVRGDRRVRVLDPQEARGLEFDAAVVVEPSEFPTRLVGHGLLYTSLTRANRELVVVHSNPLPEALRVRSTGHPGTTGVPSQWKPARSSAMPEFRTAAG